MFLFDLLDGLPNPGRLWEIDSPEIDRKVNEVIMCPCSVSASSTMSTGSTTEVCSSGVMSPRVADDRCGWKQLNELSAQIEARDTRPPLISKEMERQGSVR
jgi:hypothetical protein